jgi:DNA-binding beta-propeller fold protein YncE
VGRRRANLQAWALLLAACSLASCGRDAPPTAHIVPRDTHPPELRIIYPTEAYGAYDRDSNGLADLEVAWSDSGGVVSPSTLRVTCIDCLPGVQQDSNLVPGWRTVRCDSTGASLEETLSLLMAHGTHLLRVTVADTAGNVSVEKQVLLNLPGGAYYRTIDLAYPAQWQHTRPAHLALTPDGGKGFVPFIDGHLAVFDPEGVVPTHYIGPVTNSGFAAQISLDSATGLAYIGGGGDITPGFHVVDTRREQPLDWYLVGLGIAGVHVEGNRIFAGEGCTTGRIIVLDKVTMQELGRVQVGAPMTGFGCPDVRTFAFSSDGRQGWAGGSDGLGLVWFDPQTYTFKQRFRLLSNALPDNYGYVLNLRLVNDRWLYLARTFSGLDEWDTQSGNVVTAHYPTWVSDLAVAPNRQLLFVTAAPDGASTNTQALLLFEIPGLRLRYAFPQRPLAAPYAAVFHPDGKRVYVIADFNVDVYLIRP